MFRPPDHGSDGPKVPMIAGASSPGASPLVTSGGVAAVTLDAPWSPRAQGPV